MYKNNVIVLLKVQKKYRKKKSKHSEDKKRKNNTAQYAKCAVCDRKKSNFIKQHEASGLLSSLGIKTSLIKICLVGPLLF